MVKSNGYSMGQTVNFSCLSNKISCSNKITCLTCSVRSHCTTSSSPFVERAEIQSEARASLRWACMRFYFYQDKKRKRKRKKKERKKTKKWEVTKWKELGTPCYQNLCYNSQLCVIFYTFRPLLQHTRTNFLKIIKSTLCLFLDIQI